MNLIEKWEKVCEADSEGVGAIQVQMVETDLRKVFDDVKTWDQYFDEFGWEKGRKCFNETIKLIEQKIFGSSKSEGYELRKNAVSYGKMQDVVRLPTTQSRKVKKR